MKTITQTHSIDHAEENEIHVGEKIVSSLHILLKEKRYSSLAILTDSTTAKLFLPAVSESLEKLSLSLTHLSIPSGEKSKDITTLTSLLTQLYEGKHDRKSALIVLGGGVVGDIGTLLAGLYYRGIDCIQIPTTLLSMVDSSLGGKGAVDLGEHKNTVGIIRQPKMIIIDTSLLKSLPKEQVTSGMGEIVKYAVAMDLELAEKLEDSQDPVENISWIINRCVKLKMDIVKKDPLDVQGIRAVLNFGHTLGQAIELPLGITHGEAVAIGMVVAINISQKMGLLSEEDSVRAVNLIKKFHLPTSIPKGNISEIIEQMKKDKKSIEGSVRMVLLTGIGQAVTNKEVTDSLLQEVLKEMML